MLFRIRWATAVLSLVAVGSARSSVVEIIDKEEWIAAVGPFATVDFTGFPDFTVITEQYAHLGIHFTDGNDRVFLSGSAFPNDGAGLDGNGDIPLSFDTPQAWIGVDYPGLMQIELYSAGQLIFTSDVYDGGVGNFLGLISSDVFDAAVLIDPMGEAEIDDLHFGVPAPATLVLFGLAALAPRRRRVLPAS